MRPLETAYKFHRYSTQQEAGVSTFDYSKPAKYWADNHPPTPVAIPNVGSFYVYPLALAMNEKGDILTNENVQPYLTTLYVDTKWAGLNIPPPIPDPSKDVIPEIPVPCNPLNEGEYLHWSTTGGPIQTVVIMTDADIPDDGKFLNSDRKTLNAIYSYLYNQPPKK